MSSADRVAYFQVNIKEKGGEPVDIPTVQELIEGSVCWQTTVCSLQELTCLRYIAFAEEEHSEAKKERRPGRPASAKEDLMKMRLETLQKEHQQGFCECSRPLHKNTFFFPTVPLETDQKHKQLFRMLPQRRASLHCSSGKATGPISATSHGSRSPRRASCVRASFQAKA